MKILISAAEISSDIQAAACLSSLIQKLKENNQKVEIAGVGGPLVRELEGFRCIEKAENLRVMGLVEVLGKLSFIKKTQLKLLEAMRSFKPDLIITFDYPDFHLRLMKKFLAIESELKIKPLKICAIPPKVWVWRQHRVEQIRKYYDGVLVVFPFEKNFYESKKIPVIYQGNPLIARLPFSLPEKEDSEAISIAVFPGSRDSELKFHLPLVEPTLQLLALQTKKKVIAQVPVTAGNSILWVRERLKNSKNVEYVIHEGQSYECLKAAKVGLIKSGTSTLEAVLLGLRPVIFYKVSPVTEFLVRRITRYLGPVGLPNILLGIKERKKAYFPEFIGAEATPEKLSQALFAALNANSPIEQNELKEIQLKLKKMLVPTEDVPSAIAQEIMKWIQSPPARSEKRKTSFGFKIFSILWSSVNFIRRRFVYLSGGPRALDFSPSVLVGNLQAGGSGKTPLVQALAKEAAISGLKVAILSRGYGGSRRSGLLTPKNDQTNEPVLVKEWGDEVVELHQSLPSAVLVVGKDRHASIRLLKEWSEKNKSKIDLVLLDDGFQNLKFKADATILCLTDREPGEILYRDFLSETKFANEQIFTKGKLSEIKWQTEALPSIPVWLFCALGDPEEVKSFYQERGLAIARTVFKKDHANFDRGEVTALMQEAALKGAMLAVTEKDFVKLQELGFEAYTDNLLTLSRPILSKIIILRRSMDVKELFKRILGR